MFSAGSRGLAALLLGGIPVISSGFAFITPVGQNAPFSRLLWNQPVLNGIMWLDYSIGPAGTMVRVGPGGDGRWGTADDVQRASVGFGVANLAAVFDAEQTWDAENPQNGNIDYRGLPNRYDFQSTALHELGHALGLNHPNYADRPADINGTRSRRSPVHDFGTNRIDNLRPGNDQTWGTADDPGAVDDTVLNVSPLSPYAPAGVVDWISVTRSLLVPTREQALRRGFADTEAVMVQGTQAQERQRQLGYDDRQGLDALETGRDYLSRDAQSRLDDFDYQFNLGDATAPITIYNVDLQGMAGITSGIGGPGRIIALDLGLDDVLSDTTDPGRVLGITELLYDTASMECRYFGAEVGCSAHIRAVNIYLDAAAHGVPEPATLVLLGTGLLACLLAQACPRSRNAKSPGRSRPARPSSGCT